MNLARNTIGSLSEELRQDLVNRGELSDLALTRPHWDPQAKLKFRAFTALEQFPDRYSNPEETGVPLLDRRFKKDGSPNFHNIAFVDISAQMLRDDLYVIRNYPREYLERVKLAFFVFRQPASNSSAGRGTKLDRYHVLHATFVHGCLVRRMENNR